jgi:hypothetical protein
MGVGSGALRRSSTASAPEEPGGRQPARPRVPAGAVTRSGWILLAVAGVLAAGVVLRFFTRSDLWADEVLSVNIAGLPLGDLPDALRQDGAPPLYYALLHFWMEVFGTGNEAVRSLSGVIGVAALVPAWFVGRRLDERRIRAGLATAGSRVVAWTLTLLLAASPFAIRYATEARMYALVILLVLLGYLALARALDRPSWGRLACLALITALLLATHYWAFPLLLVVAAWLVLLAWRGAAERRRAAVWSLGAIAVGALTFVPWLGVFRDQAAHTGTPWGGVVSPVASAAEAFKSFGGNTHAVGWALLLMLVLAVFARAVDARHIDVDLWTQPGVRTEAALALAVLGVGLVLARVTDTTFEGRYAAAMFPLFLAAAAYGITAFSSRAVRYSVLAILLVGGFWGGTSNALRNRTQAFEIANAIEQSARPGDLVVYCPDSLGTDVDRLLDDGFRQVGLPGFHPPGRIDWRNYTERVDAMRPVQTMRRVERLAGGATIWFVYTAGTQTLQEKCGQVADALIVFRPVRTRVIEPDPYFFEHHGLYKFNA